MSAGTGGDPVFKGKLVADFRGIIHSQVQGHHRSPLICGKIPIKLKPRNILYPIQEAAHEADLLLVDRIRTCFLKKAQSRMEPGHSVAI